MDRVNNLEIQDVKPKDIVTGKDLKELGFEAGPIFGRIIEFANKMDEEGFTREDIISEIEKRKEMGKDF